MHAFLIYISFKITLNKNKEHSNTALHPESHYIIGLVYISGFWFFHVLYPEVKWVSDFNIPKF